MIPSSWIVSGTLAAFALIAIELFLAPGLGICGGLGLILIFAAAYFTAAGYGALMGAALLASCLILLTLAFILFFRPPSNAKH